MKAFRVARGTWKVSARRGGTLFNSAPLIDIGKGERKEMINPNERGGVGHAQTASVYFCLFVFNRHAIPVSSLRLAFLGPWCRAACVTFMSVESVGARARTCACVYVCVRVCTPTGVFSTSRVSQPSGGVGTFFCCCFPRWSSFIGRSRCATVE